MFFVIIIFPSAQKQSFLKIIIISNDWESNFFSYVATVPSPHRNVLQEGRLQVKMHSHSIFKGVLCANLKDFDQSQELKTIAEKSLQFYMFPVLFKLARPEFVILN